jgi:hypothetical protein
MGREGQDEMSNERKNYWFVAAVFRAPGDLGAAVGELRASRLNGRFLVIANHNSKTARTEVNGHDGIAVLSVHADSLANAGEVKDLSPELRALVRAMDGAGEEGDGERQSRIYAQLRRDVAEGAIVLIASVANAEEQLLGARVLLRGNCECVLTHEIAAQRP